MLVLTHRRSYAYSAFLSGSSPLKCQANRHQEFTPDFHRAKHQGPNFGLGPNSKIQHQYWHSRLLILLSVFLGMNSTDLPFLNLGPVWEAEPSNWTLSGEGKQVRLQIQQSCVPIKIYYLFKSTFALTQFSQPLFHQKPCRPRHCGFDNVDIEKKYVISPMLLWNEVITCESVSYKFRGC